MREVAILGSRVAWTRSSLTLAAAVSVVACGGTPQPRAPDAEVQGSAGAKPNADAPPSALEEKYQASFIGVSATNIGGYTVRSVAGMQGGGYVMPTEVWDGYRGQQHDQLSQLEFYEAVDRPDLRKKTIRHAILTGSVAVVGVGLLVGGGVYLYSNWDDPDASATPGWVLVGSGFVCVVTAYILGKFSIDSWEAQKLANTHNRRLRLKLGLPPALPNPQEPDRRRIFHPMRRLAELDDYKSLTLSYSF